MKKAAAFTGLLLMAVQACFLAAADVVTPATGERTNIIPYILGIVALIIIIAFVWLTYLSKKDKK